MATILQAGRNCWRLEPALRAAALVDGAACFALFRAAAAQARRSILIAGRNVNSRTRLLRKPARDDLPAGLGRVLRALLARQRSPEVHVLNWDFAILHCPVTRLAGKPTAGGISTGTDAIHSARPPTRRSWRWTTAWPSWAAWT